MLGLRPSWERHSNLLVRKGVIKLRRESYKITISKVIKEEVEKTREGYFNQETAEEIDWSKWYKLDEDEKKNYIKREVPTGETEINEREEKIYEQEVNDLDIGEVAVYINRAR